VVTAFVMAITGAQAEGLALLYKLQPNDVWIDICAEKFQSTADQDTVILNELFKCTPHSFSVPPKNNHEDLGLVNDLVMIMVPAFLSTAQCTQCQSNILWYE
jgi:hypothetical protein